MVTELMDLRPHIGEIARRLIGVPNPHLSTKTQLRFGTNGSVAVDIDGPKAGSWYDHEAGHGGGPWELMAIKGGMANGQAVEWLRSELHIEIETGPKSPRQIVATYNYRDERGDLLFQVCRFDPKDFRQRRPDSSGSWEWKVKGTRQVPYRLPELIAAPPGSIIYVPEGEKDVDNLVKLELTATCNPGGATSRRADGRPATSKWRPEFNQFFRSRDVCVIADNDAAGRDHARAVERALAPVAKRVCILELPGLSPKGDVTDWL
jgi:hypothetical protein